MRVDASGNVGIGTTSPYAKLSVVGPVVAEYFHATSTTATSTLQRFRVGSTTAGNLVVDRNTGNVGIGTTAPGARLHVLGSGIVESTTNQSVITFKALAGKNGYVGTSLNGGVASGINDGDVVLRAEGGNALHLSTTVLPNLL